MSAIEFLTDDCNTNSLQCTISDISVSLTLTGTDSNDDGIKTISGTLTYSGGFDYDSRRTDRQAVVDPTIVSSSEFVVAARCCNLGRWSFAIGGGAYEAYELVTASGQVTIACTCTPDFGSLPIVCADFPKSDDFDLTIGVVIVRQNDVPVYEIGIRVAPSFPTDPCAFLTIFPIEDGTTDLTAAELIGSHNIMSTFTSGTQSVTMDATITIS